jgi:hypothetical protein
MAPLFEFGFRRDLGPVQTCHGSATMANTTSPVKTDGSGSGDAHDTAVMARINRHIQAVNKKYPDATVAEKLEFAWAANIEERKGDPTNEIGRDADYYFAARKELALSSHRLAKYAKAGLGPVAWTVYAGLKIGSEVLQVPELLRSDPDKPNAAVGGFGWMNRGSAAGLDDNGSRVGDVMPCYADGQLPAVQAPQPLRPRLP